MTETRKLDLIQHIRPLHLMTLIVLYFLGVGFGRYLGQRIDLVPLLVGLFWILTLSIGLNFLGDYFQTPFDWGLIRKEQGGNDSQEKNRDEVLETYVNLYIMEEVQFEGLIRNIGNFSRFLSVIAFSHGNTINLNNIARECEVKRTVVEGFIKILVLRCLFDNDSTQLFLLTCYIFHFYSPQAIGVWALSSGELPK